MSTLNFLAKLAKIPDVDYIHDAVRAVYAEMKIAIENAICVIKDIKTDLNKTGAVVEKTATFVEQASTIAKEAKEIRNFRAMIPRALKAYIDHAIE
ncbi:hypothetical protein S7711_09703 [Stachybotrys chartarum IBT 7711]|uniref:Uncharacterized protein n=1 Tax=Stachybotrys chartarum (strain CBS 109288 / IBT 7711) TaxID=1280523 RepID=A0A084B291_STACB|nr:hypothetical protein S7711_09703 [Stachybotrys chartarum IBT 7711]